MLEILKKNHIKSRNFRISHCGKFPNYSLNGVSFTNRNLIYLVSVGKEKFEYKWVERFVNFIAEIKPKKVLIVVADTLQRFNIEVDEDIDPRQALNESSKRGKEWVNKYKPLFSNLNKSNIDYEFIYWETLKKDKDFDYYFNEIKKLDEKDSDFKTALAISSKGYAKRPARQNSVAIYQKAEANSRLFLLEECAVLGVLAKDATNLAIVYPGAVTNILDYAIKNINENHRDKKNNFHWLDLKPTKQNKKKKDTQTKTKEKSKPLLFRSNSLNEVQWPTYQAHKDLNTRQTFFKSASLSSINNKPQKYLHI